jgi:hypothetical protein
MTASERNNSPNFFEEHTLDPVGAATRHAPSVKTIAKKKAGFYLSEAVLERFNRCFHEMKLAGIPVENKSDLLEKALQFALNDLENGNQSQLMHILKQRPHRRHLSQETI